MNLFTTIPFPNIPSYDGTIELILNALGMKEYYNSAFFIVKGDTPAAKKPFMRPERL
jgi:hypothetical protein